VRQPVTPVTDLPFFDGCGPLPMAVPPTPDATDFTVALASRTSVDPGVRPPLFPSSTRPSEVQGLSTGNGWKGV
jgi:hypothetical protein